MNRDGSTAALMARCAACALAVLAAFVTPSGADLVHKYTFNDNTADDSEGSADGVVVDNTGIARYTGGAIDLTGNNGANSNQDFTLPETAGAFVDLPNGIFTNAVTGGSFGAVTLETWITVQENRAWAEAFVFGTSDGGEGASTGGGGSAYVAMIPNSGPGDFRATTKAATGMPAEIPIIGSDSPLPTNQRHHVVLALDQADTTTGLNGTASLYLNNAAPVTAEIAGFLDFIVDNNNWLGRSQWPDPLFDGLIDEFRIYDHALSAGEVETSFNTGPEPAPLPVLVVDRDTGDISIANQSGGNVQLKGYTIESAGGAIDPVQWTSIDAGNAFDPDGTWTTTSEEDVEVGEAVTGGATDGGTLGPPSSFSVGEAWRQTPIEDLSFSFTLGDDSVQFGQVLYEGNGGVAFGRSDLNADGEVDVADWSLFLPNAFTSFTGETDVNAYLMGDLDGDGDNDYDDFQLFKTDYINANGEEAFAALPGRIPEPTTALLTALAASAWGASRRRSLGL